MSRRRRPPRRGRSGWRCTSVRGRSRCRASASRPSRRRSAARHLDVPGPLARRHPHLREEEIARGLVPRGRDRGRGGREGAPLLGRAVADRRHPRRAGRLRTSVAGRRHRQWQQSPYRALRQNALRMLIANSPDLQTGCQREDCDGLPLQRVLPRADDAPGRGAGRAGPARIEKGMPLPAGTGLSRRSFLLRSGAAAALGLRRVEARRSSSSRRASPRRRAAATPVLVSVFLDGGADSLSVLAPVERHASYHALAPDLALGPGEGRASPRTELRWHPGQPLHARRPPEHTTRAR